MQTSYLSNRTPGVDTASKKYLDNDQDERNYDPSWKDVLGQNLDEKSGRKIL